jgi:hypothetical protein
MRVLFLGIIFLLSSTISAKLYATTYHYVGTPLTLTPSVPSLNCNPNCSVNGLTGNVSFSSDTSAFTGSLTLSSGDTAELIGSLPGVFIFPSLSYPFNNPPAGTPGIVTSLQSGIFTFVDGSIVSWSFGLSRFFQNCGGGPGCAANAVSESTSTDGDSIVGFSNFPLQASNSQGGSWTEIIVTPVPEPSTWAMLLIGFAGIGFASYRKSRRPWRVFPWSSLNSRQNDEAG